MRDFTQLWDSKINTKETLSWLCAHSNIMWFFLKQQQNCHAQIQQDFLATSSLTEFLCLHIWSNILHFWQSLLFYLITGSWHKKIYCDSFTCSAALWPWKLVLFALSAFPLWNLIVSDLNLWQALNKSSNICSCSRLKHSKGVNKSAIFTWWRLRKNGVWHLQTADCRPQTADRRLQTADCMGQQDC